MNRKMNLTVALVIGSMSAFATSAFAGEPSPTGSLLISGSVDAVAQVEIFSVGSNSSAIESYTSLNLVTGESAQGIATIHEKCNHESGYTMTISHSELSAKSFLSSSTTSSKIAYTLTYGGAAVGFTDGAKVFTTNGMADYPYFTNKALAITIVADDLPEATPNSGVVGFNKLSILPAGVYSDTLIFTIAAKA